MIVAAVVVLVEHQRQVQGRTWIPWFSNAKLLQVPEGKYVEVIFIMRCPTWSRPACIRGRLFEVRDGYNQAANVLGIFCGDYFRGIIRSSGRYMWLQFSSFNLYRFRAVYTGKLLNVTGSYDLYFTKLLYLLIFTKYKYCPFYFLTNLGARYRFFWISFPAYCIVGHLILPGLLENKTTL